MPALATLYLRTSDISALGACTALTALHLTAESNGVFDFGAMVACTKLRKVVLHALKGVMNLRLLVASCTRLTSLALHCCTKDVGMGAQALLSEWPRLEITVSEIFSPFIAVLAAF